MKAFFILVCVAYILSPVDFLPDAIPFLGTADDGLAGILAGAVLRTVFESEPQVQVVRRR